MMGVMGKLIDGKWSTEWYQASAKGDFIRDETKFRGTVTAGGSSGFPAEAGRYHLYVSLACPWAHRALIARQLKGLQNAISVSVVHPHMGELGWEFAEFPGATPDSIHGARYLSEVYTRAKSDYTGRVTVPVLWDRQTDTIVNNESRQIMRMLDHEFDALGDASVDLCPRELTAAIDAEIDALYQPVNNGVYRAGFAVKQAAYETAVRELFAALDGYEARLEKQRYLLGASLCNLRRIADYPALFGYLRDIYQTPGVAEVCDLVHIKHHYFTSHPTINPNQIIPLGPMFNLLAPQQRAALAR
jgi:glutathionyl-hydroquinone reductase